MDTCFLRGLSGATHGRTPEAAGTLDVGCCEECWGISQPAGGSAVAWVLGPWLASEAGGRASEAEGLHWKLTGTSYVFPDSSKFASSSGGRRGGLYPEESVGLMGLSPADAAECSRSLGAVIYFGFIYWDLLLGLLLECRFCHL